MLYYIRSYYTGREARGEGVHGQEVREAPCVGDLHFVCVLYCLVC